VFLLALELPYVLVLHLELQYVLVLLLLLHLALVSVLDTVYLIYKKYNFDTLGIQKMLLLLMPILY
jgi:hypothetical protein